MLSLAGAEVKNLSHSHRSAERMSEETCFGELKTTGLTSDMEGKRKGANRSSKEGAKGKCRASSRKNQEGRIKCCNRSATARATRPGDCCADVFFPLF